ncbi:alpha/beta fold hydrolase [Chondromyces crocatus]|nr:alpha/beta fold hydrolase [Chondromyces crocatus]
MSITCLGNTRPFCGGDLHWEEWSGPRPHGGGERRPLVLIHGLSDSCRTWNLVAPALSAGRRVFALDLPGHGRSARPDASYDVAWYAGVVADWISSLEIDEFDLIGHSLGGGIAMRLLLELPGRVQRLALLATGGLGTEVALPLRLAAVSGFLDLAAPLLMGMGTHAGMMMLGGNFNASERRHLARVNATPGTGRALSRTLRGSVDLKGQVEHFLDHSHRLGDLPPLAIYWGDQDPVIPVRHADEVVRYLEGVRVRRFTGAGHYPHREAATELVPELLRFLEEPQATPRIRANMRAPRRAAPARPRMAIPLARKLVGLV